MDSTKTYFNKLPIKNDINDEKDNHILIQTQWLDKNIIIFIHELTTSKSFKGELTTNELQESAKELEIPYEEFYSDCRKALTTNHGLESFIYEFDRDENKLLLNKKATFTIQYLDIQLQENNKSISKMLDAAIDIINEQTVHSVETVEINEKLQQSYNDTVDAFERCIEEKNNLESKLLKKFTLLLNSKKNKIAELQEILVEKGYNLGNNDTNQAHNKEEDYNMVELGTEPSTSAVAKERTQQRKNKVMTIESDEDDDDYLAATQEMTPPRGSVNDESN